jgi:hypothetical protein
MQGTVGPGNLGALGGGHRGGQEVKEDHLGIGVVPHAMPDGRDRVLDARVGIIQERPPMLTQLAQARTSAAMGDPDVAVG